MSKRFQKKTVNSLKKTLRETAMSFYYFTFTDAKMYVSAADFCLCVCWKKDFEETSFKDGL